MSLTLERQAFTVEPLSPVLGASITGLDLRQRLPEATRSAVYDAFIRYHVLCFRDQHLDHEQQIAFSEQFGTLERHMAMNRGKVHPLVHIVTNLDADGQQLVARLIDEQVLRGGIVVAAVHHPLTLTSGSLVSLELGAA